MPRTVTHSLSLSVYGYIALASVLINTVTRSSNHVISVGNQATRSIQQ
jgi:hypothetical protein